MQEDEVLLTRTLHGVMSKLSHLLSRRMEEADRGITENISHLCSRQKSRVWGKDGWKKIVVCIISDGRKVVHPRVLDWYVRPNRFEGASVLNRSRSLGALGVYQRDVGKNRVDNKTVQSHLYEYTAQLSIDPQLKFKGLEKGIVPTQIIFCLKEKSKLLPPLPQSQITDCPG